MKSGPLEAKVAASGLAAFAVSSTVTVVFGFAGVNHWWPPQPAWLLSALSGLLVTLATWAAGWKAPHTHLRPEPPAVHGTLATGIERTPAGDLTFTVPSYTTGNPVAPPPAVQQPATTTGGTTP